MTKKNKILLVDDEEDILEFLSYNLIKEGYEIRTASNGLSAIKTADSFKPDLVILDIMMPGMDGIELCNHLRVLESTKKCLIAFLTARGEDYTQIAALDNGGDDFIQKPIRPKVLLSRVKALLRRSKVDQSMGHVISVGPLQIDFEGFVAILDGQKLDLARKEFKLLQLLASKPGKVFRRYEILDAVWGQDVIVGDRTIDVHIRKLREKLKNNLIKTVKGVGYKIDF